MAEMRVSPDGDSVAIRSERDESEWNAWAVIHRRHGGYWATSDQVDDWTPLTVRESAQ